MAEQSLLAAEEKAELNLPLTPIKEIFVRAVGKIAREITRFSKSDIGYLFKSAKRLKRSPYFDILRAPAQKDFGRVLLVVSKKVGNAPTRNKIRRHVRSIFYESQQYKKSFDWVFIAKAPITDIDFELTKKLLLEVFSYD